MFFKFKIIDSSWIYKKVNLLFKWFHFIIIIKHIQSSKTFCTELSNSYRKFSVGVQSIQRGWCGLVLEFNNGYWIFSIRKQSSQPLSLASQAIVVFEYLKNVVWASELSSFDLIDCFNLIIKIILFGLIFEI